MQQFQTMFFVFMSCFSIGVFGPLPANAEPADEISVEFIDDMVAGCLAWIDHRDSSFFESSWRLTEQARRERKLAETDPALASNPNAFFSPQYNFSAGYGETDLLVSCSVGNNFMWLDENYAPLSGYPEFDYEKGVRQMTLWGLKRAAKYEFEDWLEAATDFFGPDLPDHFVFMKKRCNLSGLTKLTGTAYTTKQSGGILPLPSWSLRVQHYDREAFKNDPKITAYINQACPELS